MAEEKKGKGLFRQISEVLIVDVAKKVGGFLIIVGIILKIADVIIPKIGFDLPFGMGRMSLPQTDFFDQYVGTLSEIAMSLLFGALSAFFWPVAIVLVVWLIWGFLHWAPVKNEPVIWKRIVDAFFRGVHAGARKGGELTAKGAKRAAAEIKKKRIEAGKCPSCGASRLKGAKDCAYCGRKFVAPRLVSNRALKFEFRRWTWTIQLPGQSKPVPPPVQPPVFPPPETLEPVLSVSDAPVEIVEEEFPIEPEASDGDLFKIEEEE